MRKIFFSLALLLFSACTEEVNSEEPINDTQPAVDTPTIDTAVIVAQPDTVVTCYRFDAGEEHNWMVMNRIGDTAYGELHYTWEGKDGSNGKFHGNFHGDTLWIIFNSYGEGHFIAFERVYLLSGDKLFEGEGLMESNEAGNYDYFVNKRRIEFSQENFLEKRLCQ